METAERKFSGERRSSVERSSSGERRSSGGPRPDPVWYIILMFLLKVILWPVQGVTWVLGSPYLMTLLCIMSEVFIELVVSTVLAGVSLVVSAVLLLEDDRRPVNNYALAFQPKPLPDQPFKDKRTSTGTLEKFNKPQSSVMFNVPEVIVADDEFFSGSKEELAESEKAKEEMEKDEERAQITAETPVNGEEEKRVSISQTVEEAVEQKPGEERLPQDENNKSNKLFVNKP